MSRVALITGGSKGLGAHLVRRFWLDGYSVGVVARNRTDICSVLAELPKRSGQRATPLECDLADTAKVAALINAFKATIPHLDVLVNNAAMQGPIGPLCGNDLSEWKQTLQVNLLAPVAFCNGLIPLMKSRMERPSSIFRGRRNRASCKFQCLRNCKSGFGAFQRDDRR